MSSYHVNTSVSKKHEYFKINVEDMYIPIAVFTFCILFFIRIFVFIRIWKSTWIKLIFTSTVCKNSHRFPFSLPGDKWRVTSQANTSTTPLTETLQQNPFNHLKDITSIPRKMESFLLSSVLFPQDY